MPKFLIVASLVTWTQVVFALTDAEFRDACAANGGILRTRLTKVPPVGQVTYQPTGALRATQNRFSLPTCLIARERVIKKGGATLDPESGTWTFKHGEGTSPFAKDKALAVTYYKGRLDVQDGTHRSLISIGFLAPMAPVLVRADMSHLSPAAYARWQKESKFAYRWNHLGQWESQRKITELANDPNLRLARLLRYRADVEAKGNRLVLVGGSGPEVAIAIKTGRDVNHYEFLIADALRRAGVEFDDTRDEADLSPEELEHYLNILKEAARDPGSRLHGFLLLDKPRRVAKLDLQHLILNHLLERGCQGHLGSPGGGD